MKLNRETCRPVRRFPTRGSTQVLNLVSLPKAQAAFERTGLRKTSHIIRACIFSLQSGQKTANPKLYNLKDLFSWKETHTYLSKKMNLSFAEQVLMQALDYLALSCRHFMKVVCNWGRKGFKATPPLLINTPRVARIELLTCHGNLSPTIRIKGLHTKWFFRN